jgi:hypothetical protein
MIRRLVVLLLVAGIAVHIRFQTPPQPGLPCAVDGASWGLRPSNTDTLLNPQRSRRLCTVVQGGVYDLDGSLRGCVQWSPRQAQRGLCTLC